MRITDRWVFGLGVAKPCEKPPVRSRSLVRDKQIEHFPGCRSQRMPGVWRAHSIDFHVA